jgi:hypothetical protein
MLAPITRFARWAARSFTFRTRGLNAGQPSVLSHPSRAAAAAAVRDSPFAVTRFTGEGIDAQLFLHARRSFGRADGQMEEDICAIEFLGRSSETKATKNLAKQVREIWW